MDTNKKDSLKPIARHTDLLHINHYKAVANTIIKEQAWKIKIYI